MFGLRLTSSSRYFGIKYERAGYLAMQLKNEEVKKLNSCDYGRGVGEGLRPCSSVTAEVSMTRV